MSVFRRRIMASKRNAQPQRILLLSQDFIEADVTSDNYDIGDYWDNVRDKVYTYEFEYEITNNVGTNNSLRVTNSMSSTGLFSANIARTSKVHTFTAIGSTRHGRAFRCRIGSSNNSYHVKIWNLKIYQEPD